MAGYRLIQQRCSGLAVGSTLPTIVLAYATARDCPKAMQAGFQTHIIIHLNGIRLDCQAINR